MKIILRRILRSTLIKKTLKLSFVSAVSNLFNFLIPIYIAYAYGVSKETDNFFLCYSIITFASTIFSGTVRVVVVPFLKERADNKEGFEIFISSTLFYISKFFGLISILSFALTFTLSKLASNNEFYFFLALSTPIFFLSIVNAFFYGVLNSINQYYIAEASPFSRALIILITIFFLQNELGVTSILIGYNLGELAKLVHLIYAAKYKNKLRLSLRGNSFEVIRNFVRVGSTQVISSVLGASSPLVDKVIASFLIVGSVSILDYGDKLFMVLNVIFNSFLSILLTKWSSDVLNNKFDFKKMNSIIVSAMISILLLFLLVLNFGRQLVHFLYPSIGPQESELISIVLIINVGAFVFTAANQIIHRASIAFRDTKILLKVSTVRIVTNIVFDVVFGLAYGVIGIAIATVVVNILCTSLNYYMFLVARRQMME